MCFLLQGKTADRYVVDGVVCKVEMARNWFRSIFDFLFFQQREDVRESGLPVSCLVHLCRSCVVYWLYSEDDIWRDIRVYVNRSQMWMSISFWSWDLVISFLQWYYTRD